MTSSRSATADLSGTVRYFYDGWREIEERGGGPTQQYVYGMWIDEPLTLDIDGNNDGRIEPSDTAGNGDSDRFDQITKDKRFFYSDDGKRFTAALTDINGAVVERYRYDAYGVPTITDAVGAQRNQSAVNNRYLFNARRFDPESGLYYYRNRYMEPRTGRFIHREPGGLWASKLNNGNAYAYVGSNPVNMNDPSGHARIEANWSDQSPTLIQRPRYLLMTSKKDSARCRADCLEKGGNKTCILQKEFDDCKSKCIKTENIDTGDCISDCEAEYCYNKFFPEKDVNDCLSKCPPPNPPPSPPLPEPCPWGVGWAPNCKCPAGQVYNSDSNVCREKVSPPLDWQPPRLELPRRDDDVSNPYFPSHAPWSW